ncbi:MAG: sulfur carrier protein ThiS [Tannerellaceae bacterium]|nr:sulfur carrier protein ThiS [Tannerellaceae bacterium]
MTIYLNEKVYEVEPDTSLSEFITSIGLAPQGIVVAINNKVVPKPKWEETLLAKDMELLLIKAVSGG